MKRGYKSLQTLNCDKCKKEVKNCGSDTVKVICSDCVRESMRGIKS